MRTDLLGAVALFILPVLAAIPLGRYLAMIFQNERTWADRVFEPLDRLFYRLGGVDPTKDMTWKEHILALLTINGFWLLLSVLVLSNMGWLPLNPDGNPSMSLDLAFNTSVSFVTNTNLQHYSGETGLTYLGQLVLMLWQFVSAATGIAICVVVFQGMRTQTAASLGNFYRYFVRSSTRVLLPLAFGGALVLVFSGVPMTFEGKATQMTLEGAEQQISRGPAAAFVAIKQLGTNGGGYYGPNSTNPMENPDDLTNALQTVYILLLPMAMVFAMGHIIRRKKLAWVVFGVMTLGFFLLLLPSIYLEMSGNPAIAGLGIAQPQGSMEGKEVRIGSVASAFWAISTTCTSNGSVNAMHDSLTPLTGMFTMLGMMVNSFYGGVGVGFINFFVFIILAVFMGGLMVGRTPELLGKKVEAREVKIAMAVALLHPLLILGGTALAAALYTSDPAAYSGWLANPGYHGFSEMLYEFCSAGANNGSGFEGLGDNTPFWNLSTAIVMLLGRYLPIIGPVAIAGSLAAKKYIPESSGTLKVESATFGVLVFAVIAVVAALAFFPALSLGPLAEFFSIG